jgi:hypothetical protein
VCFRVRAAAEANLRQHSASLVDNNLALVGDDKPLQDERQRLVGMRRQAALHEQRVGPRLWHFLLVGPAALAHGRAPQARRARPRPAHDRRWPAHDGRRKAARRLSARLAAGERSEGRRRGQAVSASQQEHTRRGGDGTHTSRNIATLAMTARHCPACRAGRMLMGRGARTHSRQTRAEEPVSVGERERRAALVTAHAAARVLWGARARSRVAARALSRVGARAAPSRRPTGPFGPLPRCSAGSRLTAGRRPGCGAQSFTMGIKQLTKLIGDQAPEAIKVLCLPLPLSLPAANRRRSPGCAPPARGCARQIRPPAAAARPPARPPVCPRWCRVGRGDAGLWSTSAVLAALPARTMGRSRGVCSQEIKIEAYFGRKVAVDASMSIYQFLIAMQRPDGTNMLTNDAGEVTSHINGLMMRTTKMLECGIKPVYVFDGKPPDLKKGTLDDRREKRQEADEALAKAKEEGDQEAVEKVRHVANATSLAVGVDDEECAC